MSFSDTDMMDNPEFDKKKPVNELKPCPFCKGKGDIATTYYDDFPNEYSCFCRKCRVETKLFPTEGIAVNFWNTRSK